MIIVQTPLRISLAGGGTDFFDYYKDNGGAVVSTTIDKYIYVIVKARFDKKIRVGYSKTEMVDSVDEIEHQLVREAMRKVGVRYGIEIATMADIPSEGSARHLPSPSHYSTRSIRLWGTWSRPSSSLPRPARSRSRF
jgi:D-glycero-alpha-D-manno-heptose-7-phosphate kinase